MQSSQFTFTLEDGNLFLRAYCDKAIQQNSWRFFYNRPKVGQGIIAENFTNNCLLNALNLECLAGFNGEKKPTFKACSEMQWRHVAKLNCSKSGASSIKFQILVLVKCFVKHSPFFEQHSTLFAEALLPFYAPAL